MQKMQKVDKTIQKIESNIEKNGLEKMDNSQETTPSEHVYRLGKPDCPICQGLRFIRRAVEFGDPDFGKLFVCVCRQQEITQEVRDRLFLLSNLDSLRELTFETFHPRGHVGLVRSLRLGIRESDVSLRETQLIHMLCIRLERYIANL